MKLLVVDDHPVVREGLCALLRQALDDVSVLQAGDAAEALSLSAANPDIDVVFLDLNVPDAAGVSAIADFGRAHPDLPLIVISSSETASDVRYALAAGALGYVPKSAAPQTLLAALNLVLAGEVYVPPLMAAAEDMAGTLEPLTERQASVLRLICEGATNKQIAYRLQCSEKTVKAHVTGVLRALKVATRAQAAETAASAGLI